LAWSRRRGIENREVILKPDSGKPISAPQERNLYSPFSTACYRHHR
jgi:hypothetical protein